MVKSKKRKRSSRTLQTEKRQKKLKELILRLHDGDDEDAIKDDFRKHFSNVSALEISVMERRLMADEGLEATEIMRLCNVHAAIFAESVADPENMPDDFEKPGHPIHVLKQENLALEGALDRVERLLEIYVTEPDDELRQGLLKQIDLLWQVDNHYSRKENSFFPLMENYDITAPPKVMWGVDDKIRNLIKQFKNYLIEYRYEELLDHYAELKYEMQEMVVKEEDILIPMVAEVFNEDDWIMISEEMDDIGYTIVKPDEKWVPERTSFEDSQGDLNLDSNIKIGTGHLNLDEIRLILNKLPLEITYVDAQNKVKYFNEGKKILPRTPNAIGRDVMNCHPPKSQKTVTKLIEQLRTGEKDSASAWFEAREKFIKITYDALRDDEGQYLGVLEYVQDIGPLKELQGTKKNVFIEV